jgi:predicted transcriptional regulator
MSTVKQSLREFVDTLPEDVSWEEVQRRTFVRQQVEKGLADVAAGRVVDDEEAERRMVKWLDAEK